MAAAALAARDEVVGLARSQRSANTLPGRGIQPVTGDFGDRSAWPAPSTKTGPTSCSAPPAGKMRPWPVTATRVHALAVTAVGAPDLMERISENVLGALKDLPEHDRDALLDTVEAWLDYGGSIDQIAHHMFCHPNTARQRLRRLETHTGRSVNNPRDATELFIALEMVGRLPKTP